MKVRVIRLYPVYFISALFCILIAVFQALTTSGMGVAYLRGNWHVLALTLVLLPAVGSINGNLFPLNGPYWSLFFEVVVNAIYAAIRRVLTTRFLVIVVVVFGSVIAGAAVHHGDLDMGYSWGVNSIVSGFSRAMFGIFLGLLLHRKSQYLAEHLPKGSPWLAVLMTGLVLCSPEIAGFDAWIDLVVVFVIFPVCVIWASQAYKTRMSGVLLALGSASYPLYVLHVPLGNIVSLASNGKLIAYAPYAGLAFVILLVGLSVWLERIYDIPVRRWLSRKAGNRRPMFPVPAPRL